MSGAGSGKGLPKEPRKEATSPPHPEPIGQLGAGNGPQLREEVWAALALGTRTGAGETFSSRSKNVLARTHWGGGRLA